MAETDPLVSLSEVIDAMEVASIPVNEQDMVLEILKSHADNRSTEDAQYTGKLLTSELIKAAADYDRSAEAENEGYELREAAEMIIILSRRSSSWRAADAANQKILDAAALTLAYTSLFISGEIGPEDIQTLQASGADINALLAKFDASSIEGAGVPQQGLNTLTGYLGDRYLWDEVVKREIESLAPENQNIGVEMEIADDGSVHEVVNSELL